jgi:hypothetical protein
MTPLVLYTGLGLIALGIAQLVWFVRTAAAKHVAAQAMVLMELGVIFVVPSLIPDRATATIVVGILGLGVLVSIWIQMKLLWQWRREQ